MDHTETIMHLNGALSPSFIKRMIPFVEDRAKKHLVVKSGLVTDIRNVRGYILNFNTPTNLFYWNFVKREIERLFINYTSKFPKMFSNKISQIDLLKYKPGGKYNVHTDHHSVIPRCLSVIMNLNDSYEGGDLIFTDQKNNEIKRLNLKKGSIVFFPSNFMYPHSIEPITKGTRYSIVAWLQ
tara:strand:- start:566 stop:1111 length:546 start_codon:yes stop_codon:yes gene_type:complete